MATIDIILVVGFLALMFVTGVYFSRWIREADDFYVAGRQLTPFILAATITATNVNMYSFIGQAGAAYTSGLGIIWNTWVGNMALVFAGIFVVPVMRRLQIRTVPELLELRYNKYIRLFVGLLWATKLCFWLAVILTAATVAAQTITGVTNPWIWFFAFAIIAILYSAIGGAWAVAMTDTIQFAVMLAGALIVLPVAMYHVGWMPHLLDTLRSRGMQGHLELVSQRQEFNWLFIIAMVLISTKWACIDQGILQRAFGGRDPRTVAKGMVLSGIITTPFAFLWILPALAVTQLIPGITRGDEAMPLFLTRYLPAGVLGLVVCGLLAAQMSTISSDVNSVATLIANDVYHNLKREASPRSLLKVVRASTLLSGLAMILFAYFVVNTPRFRGVVDANLTIVGIFDMPLFVIAIVYGLLWRRTNWQGAVAGYVVGAAAGGLCYGLLIHRGEWALWAKNLAAMTSTLGALLATPVVSLLFRTHSTAGMARLFAAIAARPTGASAEDFPLLPFSWPGRLGLIILGLGFMVFLVGVLAGGAGYGHASALAVSGMLLYFAGGLLRVYSD